MPQANHKKQEGRERRQILVREVQILLWNDNHRNFHRNTKEKILRLLRDYRDDLCIDGTSNYY